MVLPAGSEARGAVPGAAEAHQDPLVELDEGAALVVAAGVVVATLHAVGRLGQAEPQPCEGRGHRRGARAVHPDDEHARRRGVRRVRRSAASVRALRRVDLLSADRVLTAGRLWGRVGHRARPGRLGDALRSPWNWVECTQSGRRRICNHGAVGTERPPAGGTRPAGSRSKVASAPGRWRPWQS